MTDPSCSDQSCAAGEGLAGTAAEASSWLLLEYTGEWKPKGYDQAVLPDATRAVIDAAVAVNRGLRVQLIRRAERPVASRGLKLFLARADRLQQQLWELTVADHAAIAALDLAGWAAGADPFESAHSPRPLYLVCVHGKRDRCCATKGMPVYRRMSSLRMEETWQTTHLGGHRFAATLVCLPEGVCYGRVEEQEVEALIAAHERAELFDLARYRGRTCDDAITQAADMLMRQELGMTRLDALSPSGVEVVGSAKRVSFRTRAGIEHATTIARETLPVIQQSCDAPDRKAALRWIRA